MRKNGRKETKEKEKEEKKKGLSFFSHSRFLFPFPLKKKRKGKKERREERKNGRKYARLQGHFRCKKDLISSFDETRSFQFLLFKISHIEDKDFYLGGDKSNLREQKVFLQFSFILQRANFFSVLFVLSPSFPFPKTEKEKGDRKSVV